MARRLRAEATGSSYWIRHEAGGAADGERQRLAPVLEHFKTHLPQRSQDASHRPAAQRGIARSRAVTGWPAITPHHQPHAGAGVAEVERAVRCAQARPRRGPAPPQAPCRRSVAPSACSTRAVFEHVFCLEQPADRGAPRCQRSENEGAMGDRLVTRHTHPAGQGAPTCGSAVGAGGRGTRAFKEFGAAAELERAGRCGDRGRIEPRAGGSCQSPELLTRKCL